MRSQIILGLFLLVLCSCSASQGEADAPEVPSSGGETPSSGSPHDAEVFSTFSGTDAQAMATLGQRLEAERPPLSSALLDQMLAVLETAPGDDPGVRMLGPMLFRSAAVVVGHAALPTLQRCMSNIPNMADFCRDTAIEIEQ